MPALIAFSFGRCAARLAALAAQRQPLVSVYDHKDYMRLTVAEIVRDTLKSLDLEYPQPDQRAMARFDEMRVLLDQDK